MKAALTRTFDAETQALIYRTVDDVWSALAFSIDPRFHLVARNHIATFIFDEARRGERDAEQLWHRALCRARTLAFLYRWS